MVLLPPFDLHVLGLPLAFILSQDQTLHCKMFLHHTEVWLMSSANPTRINEFNFNVTFLLTCISILTICLFQSFKERLLLPIEATWWAAWAARFCCLQCPVLIGSAKVQGTFYFTSCERKILTFSLRLVCGGFQLKRGAKVRSFFWLSKLKGEISEVSRFVWLSCRLRLS